jgi:hypothetical protein
MLVANIRITLKYATYDIEQFFNSFLSSYLLKKWATGLNKAETSEDIIESTSKICKYDLWLLILRYSLFYALVDVQI